MSDLLVVVDDIAQVVATRVMRLAHAHGVVGEVDIAVVALFEVSRRIQSSGKLKPTEE